MNILDKVKQNYAKSEVADYPLFRSGDTLSVHVKIKEGSKSRIQIFQGVCIALKERNDLNGHFRVRKISNGVGVERVFPFHSPSVVKIEVVSRGKNPSGQALLPAQTFRKIRSHRRGLRPLRLGFVFLGSLFTLVDRIGRSRSRGFGGAGGGLWGFGKFIFSGLAGHLARGGG